MPNQNVTRIGDVQSAVAGLLDSLDRDTTTARGDGEIRQILERILVQAIPRILEMETERESSSNWREGALAANSEARAIAELIPSFRQVLQFLKALEEPDPSLIELMDLRLDDVHFVLADVQRFMDAAFSVIMKSSTMEQSTSEIEGVTESANVETLRRDRIEQLVGKVAIAADQLEVARNSLNRSVEQARAEGVSWRSIGDAVGIDAQAARRRWNPEARRKHTENRRVSDL